MLKFSWKTGDWGAYFGLLANNLINLFVMSGLLINVVKIPSEFVYGVVVPAFGLGIFAASIFYTIAAYNLEKSGKKNVTSLPSGPSAPSIFIVVFLVILPLYKATNNYYLAVSAGVAWTFVESIIELSGAFIGELLRKVVPRSVLLAALAGLGLTLLAINPLLESFEKPLISFAVLAIMYMNWFGKKPIFKKIPTGFLILIVGTIFAWILRYKGVSGITENVHLVGFNLPKLKVDMIALGMKPALATLATAIPLGITNFVFTLENIESAAAAGDEYNTRNIMLANGISSLIGCVCGCPFPTTVYIGHPGWKEIGAGIYYSLATGLSMLIISISGIGAILLGIIPLEAILPILYYVGIVVAIQAVKESPKEELPAIFVAFFPWIATWAVSIIGNVVKAASNVSGIAINITGADYITAGVHYPGLKILGDGAPISSIIWGTIAVFAIRNELKKGAIVSILGALLTFFGIMHATKLDLFVNMEYVYGYLMIAGIFILKYILEMKEKSSGN